MKLNKYKVVGVISIVLLIFTPWINTIVNSMFRSGGDQQFGFGSECLLWLFPIMVLALVDALTDQKT